MKQHRKPMCEPVCNTAFLMQLPLDFVNEHSILMFSHVQKLFSAHQANYNSVIIIPQICSFPPSKKKKKPTVLYFFCSQILTQFSRVAEYLFMSQHETQPDRRKHPVVRMIRPYFLIYSDRPVDMCYCIFKLARTLDQLQLLSFRHRYQRSVDFVQAYKTLGITLKMSYLPLYLIYTFTSLEHHKKRLPLKFEF